MKIMLDFVKAKKILKLKIGNILSTYTYYSGIIRIYKRQTD